MNTKFLSFLFPVPGYFFSDAVKVITPYTINVHYSLHYNKRVVVERYSLLPGMAQHIIGWEKLESEILLAAENNAEQYRRPGDWMSNVVPDNIHPVFAEALTPYLK